MSDRFAGGLKNLWTAEGEIMAISTNYPQKYTCDIFWAFARMVEAPAYSLLSPDGNDQYIILALLTQLLEKQIYYF